MATVAAGVDAGLADEVGAQLGGAAGGSGIEEAFAIGSRLSSFSRYQASAGFAEAVAAAGRRLIVREPDDDGPATVPFRLGGQEQVPQLEPVVQRGDALGVALVLLGRVAGDPAASDLVAGLRLLDATGEVAPAGDAFALDERVEEEGSLQLLFTLDTTALVPGAYAVEGMWPPGIDGAEPSRFLVVEPASP
ncbi:MAG TPA: hypothetical protein VMT85_22155 [Thermoanaerobaculia bacterium]|nr:hypothetical protein [Thermoanaerobaculia bacterium]